MLRFDAAGPGEVKIRLFRTAEGCEADGDGVLGRGYDVAAALLDWLERAGWFAGEVREFRPAWRGYGP